MSNKIFTKKDFYLIAEIGGNHQGSFEKAKIICDLAIKSGVDCIKFQLYSAKNLVNKKIDIERYKHFQTFELTKDQHIFLAKKCSQSGIDYTASVWDMEMFEWIEPYMKFIKVGSGDLTSYNFLKLFAKTNKPIVLSSGLSFQKEVSEAIEFIRKCNPNYNKFGMLSILQCTSMYPIGDDDANLAVIKELSKIKNIIPGYSDHTVGLDALVHSISLGAKVLEFHFTDDKKNKTFRDHQVSLELNDVYELIARCKKLITMIGNPQKIPINIEIDNGHRISFRRAIFPNRDVKKGEIITEEKIYCLRPNKGLCASKYNLLIGKKAKIDLIKDEPLEWDMFD